MPAHPPISAQSANTTKIPPQSDETDYIYLALYWDGIYRQRCANHLHSPRSKMVMVASKQPAAPRHTCPECRWLQHIAPFLPREEESHEHALPDAT